MKNKTLAVLFVATFAVLAVGSVAAFGFGKGFMKGLSDEEKTEMQDFREKLQTAIEDNDYDEWKSLMESQLTEENFNKLVDAHEKMSEMQDLREQMKTAMENGDTETAEDLREQMHELMPEKAKAHGMGYAKGFRHGFSIAEDNED